MCFFKCYVSLVRAPGTPPPRLVRLFVVNTGLGVSLACLVRWLKKSTSLQLPVAGSFVSEFRLGPPPGMKAYDVQGEDADDEDEADGGLCQAAWWQQEEDGQPEEEAAPMLLMLLVCASRNPVPGRKRYPQLHLGLVRDASGVK